MRISTARTVLRDATHVATHLHAVFVKTHSVKYATNVMPFVNSINARLTRYLILALNCVNAQILSTSTKLRTTAVTSTVRFVATLKLATGVRSSTMESFLQIFVLTDV